MKPKIVVDENLELSDVEEEIEDEDVLESSDDENWDADDDLSVTTKSPTPSPLGSPAEKSSTYGSQEPNVLPMPKTPVKDGSPIANRTLSTGESPEHSPMVPKRRRMESPKSTKTVSSANTQNDRSAGCSSPNGTSVPNEFAKPVGTLVKIGLPIPARSPECGPVVPKRRRIEPTVPKKSRIAIESPTVTETSPYVESQKGQTPPAAFSSPNGSPVSAGFEKPHETPNLVVAALPGTNIDQAAYTMPSEPPITLSPAGSLEGLSQQASVTSPIQSSVPNGSEQFNEISFPVGSLEVGSKKSKGGAAAIGPLISAARMSFPAGSRKRLAEQVTVTSGYAQSNKLPMEDTAIPAGIPLAAKLDKAGATEPNEIPTAAGSAFSSVRAFSNAIFGQWKKVQSCLVKVSSMFVFLPNASSPSASSLPAEAVSAFLPKPQPPENEPESIDMEMEEND
ncbi:hypothetical protein B9Z55_022617 [Caenorhabditis nigoni]|uniref:Uncharacterized protein n=1 Tax=Caenorhabditis nigoni TaxID=1611254 RepID=A0A2G5SL70_9PELO|nr:hypothetical protein B9Z55_022617 [Caenorhabditis nigoni]